RAVGAVLLLAAGCAKKPAPVQQTQAPPPPQPKKTVVVLLPDPDGKPSSITIRNSAGAQTLSEPYQAGQVERADTAPTAPAAMDAAEVKRVFGAEIDGLPSAEVSFLLYFGEGSEALLAESRARFPAILDAIRERRSTAITVIGHTDTTADP